MAQNQFSIGTVTFRDALNRYSTMRFKGPLARSIGHINTLGVNLNYFSSCTRKRVSVVLVGVYDTPLYGDISQKACINFADANGNLHSWILPGYIGPVERDKYGEYVPIGTLNQLIGYIQYYTANIGLSPLRSPVVRY